MPGVTGTPATEGRRWGGSEDSPRSARGGRGADCPGCFSSALDMVDEETDAREWTEGSSCRVGAGSCGRADERPVQRGDGREWKANRVGSRKTNQVGSRKKGLVEGKESGRPRDAPIPLTMRNLVDPMPANTTTTNKNNRNGGAARGRRKSRWKSREEVGCGKKACWSVRA
ncbi:hypothetical protein VTK73DRAFT_3108 [Phialemonium thermophilum]|uniref:Uncharacterized protein n=1 Tax=Phialemonium thermophilum TaxID=223376 RepID=A0ABR3VLB1_9PEZI